MTIWWKIGAVAVAAAAFFVGGYRYAAALYEAEISDMQTAHAMALKEKTDEFRANERKQIDAYALAVDELEKARLDLSKSRVDVGNLELELERVRNEAKRNINRLSEAGANPCKHFQERLASCIGLLEEGGALSIDGAKLSEEGARLSGEVAAKKDAISRIHGTVVK